MALPPEPLRDVLPRAVRVVVAEVVSVETRDDGVPTSGAPKPGAPKKVASQRVELKVQRVLRGGPATTLVVIKPVGAYALTPGNKGPFVLDGGEPEPQILGRYGPDTWRLEDLEQAL